MEKTEEGRSGNVLTENPRPGLRQGGSADAGGRTPESRWEGGGQQKQKQKQHSQGPKHFRSQGHCSMRRQVKLGEN